MPLPGVSVTATSAVTGKKFATTTDVDGNYSMTVPKDGAYVVKAELAAFAAVTHDVQMTAAAGDQTAEFALQLASRVPATPAAGATTTAGTTAPGTTPGARTPGQRPAGAPGAGGGFGGARTRTLQGRGTQTLGDGETTDANTLDATTGGVNVAMPTIGGFDTTATGDQSEAITVSGNQGVTNGLANLNEDQLRQQIQGAQDNIRNQGGNPQDQMNGVVSLLSGIQAGGAGLFGFGGGGPGGGPGGPGGGGQGGGRGGGGGGGRGGGGGGAFRNFNPAQPHGSIFYQGSNSALNSAPWSPSLKPLTNPSAYSNRFGVSISTTPYIPHLLKADTRQFVFINLTGQKNLNAFLPNPVRVPTALERQGIFSSSEQEVNGSPLPVNIYNPYTGAQFANNTILPCTAAGQTGCITPQAQALLNQYYPLPNINTDSNDPTVYNYQTVSNAGSNNVAINARYQRQLGQAQAPGQRGARGGGGAGGRGGQRPNPNAPPVLRQNINMQYAYSHSASDNRNIFLPLGGATESDGNSLNAGYVVSYGRLSDNVSLNWNRSSGETRNYFTDTNNNPSATVGICVPNGSGNSACGAQPATISDPRFYNGLPSISITNFQGLSNQTPSKTVNQTIAFSDFVSWRHKKHNFRFGGDIRRVHADSIGGNNPLGQYSFTGYATQSPSDQVDANGTATTGSGFADFLLGLPVSTKIQAGLNKIYLRENVYDWYAQDDYRVKTNVTLNFGLRYEYFAPYTEKFNHLANIDHNANFSLVKVVMPGQSGYGGTYNRGLINPDYTMYAPRIGVAYSPKYKWTKNVVIRGGYGTNFNTGQFATAARSLSFQPPFAQTQTNAATVATVGTPNPTQSGCLTQSANAILPTTANLTLANGFVKAGNTTGCSTGNPIHNSFSIDKNYRLGMVQIFNLNIQKTFGPAIVVNIGYNGSKGSNLDITGSPNSTPTGNLLAGTASPFTYETSVAGLHSNQLAVSITQRQKKGVALGLTYAYSHSIDNASSVGGSAGSTVQNFYRLDLEEANSSFDQRHLLTGTWLLELPFGPNREFLNKGGFMAKLLDGFNLSGTITAGSGNYFTPSYSGSTSEALSGNDYTQRPNRVFTQTTAGSGKLKSFFNTAAFTAPTVINGITQFGTASRNSIEGPGTLATTAALSRTVQMSGTNSMEVRITASNVFNTVQYSGINTTVNSQTYGQVTSAAAMRAVQFSARYRF